MTIFNSGGAAAFKHDARRVCVRAQGEIGPRQCRPQIRIGCTPAAPVLHQILVVTRAALVTRVVIRIERLAQRVQRANERSAQGVLHARVVDLQRAVVAARGGVPIGAAFRAAEIRQHGVPAPAGCALRGPIGVVLGLTAHIEVAVDRAGAAQHASTRTGNRAIAGMRRRRIRIAPADTVVEHRAREAGRHLDPQFVVGAARFKQQHAMTARSGQPVGEHATGRASTDDDVIPRLLRAHCCRDRFSHERRYRKAHCITSSRASRAASATAACSISGPAPATVARTR